VVDPTFRDHFELRATCSTQRYEALLALLPRMYVGQADRLPLVSGGVSFRKGTDTARQLKQPCLVVTARCRKVSLVCSSPMHTHGPSFHCLRSPAFAALPGLR